MLLPKLFKIAVTGAVLTWEIEIEDNKYRTSSGQEGGAITTTKWTTCKGKNTGKKNETTDNEQALKDATSKWNKKQELEHYRLSVEDARTLPRYFEPMLAQDYAKFKHKLNFKHNVYIQCKLNGVRCVASKFGTFSRKGKEFVSIPHINEGLKRLFVDYPDIILDGECFNNDLRQNLGDMVSLVRKSKLVPEDIEKSKQTVQYHIYDIVIPSLMESMTYSSRIKQIKELFDLYLKDNPSFKIVESKLVYSHKEIDNELKAFEDDGQEGAMIRLDETYEQKRSRFLLKYKTFFDAEYKIIAFIEGEGDLQGKVAAVKCIDVENREFESGMTGSHESWEEMWKNRENLLGKMATIKYKSLTPITERGGGVPEFGKLVAIRDYEE